MTTWRPTPAAAGFLGMLGTLGLLAGAATPAAADTEPSRARAVLHDTEGREVGTALFTEAPRGLLLELRFQGLPPGAHGMHVHETGRCEPSFDAAGDHLAPEGGVHGFLVAQGHHAGDLPNLDVPEGGQGTVELFVPRLALHGEHALLDADGSALIVHEGADDHRTQPSGASGAPMACGVIEATRTAQP